MLPSAALIHPCRGAPPEPVGDGVQGGRQPSLKSVERGKGYQQHGSGVPKIDSVMVSPIPRPSGQQEQPSGQQQSQQPQSVPLAVAAAMQPALASMNSL